MRTAEIRNRWLEFFRQRDHAIVPSTSLVSPDPSILFTIAGMVPFIPYILGTQKAPWPRVASVQKCLRTNDIENVGRTTRHGTFFQMPGNFSFGDYHKEGAINLAWELLTGSVESGGYGFDADRLWVTLWDQDAESLEVLTKGLGLDPGRIVRLPQQESFWDTGQGGGPAGPTAEWHYDRGPEYGPEAAGGAQAVWPGSTEGEDRYIEVWNLVFDEFIRGEGTGKDYPLVGTLEQKSIDTGAGLERIAYLLQGKQNMYEIDEVFPVISRMEEISGKRYGADPESDVRLRVIADHVRSALMVIGDGVRPGNEGRGYVLRRLVRRAVRAARLLGVDTAALPELLPVSRDAMSPSYPELAQDFDRISQVAYAEEEAFLRTLTTGTTILDTAVSRARSESGSGTPELSGDQAFALHDTYGFPIDLTLEMAAEQGVRVDEAGFADLMAQQRQRARADALAKKTGQVEVATYADLARRLDAPVQFLGYTDAVAEARVIGLLVDGEPVRSAQAPADVEVVLDRTPFYAEAGGQLADQGTINFSGGGIVDVADVQSPVTGLSVHRGRLLEGTLALDETGVAAIDTERRRQIAQAHTATHMVHKALHEFLGTQATQAGSENAPSRMRFDFRHGSAVPASVVSEIEERVNLRLIEDLDVTDEVMSQDEAREQGAIALFGEKYGDRVRVVSIDGDWSKELCGGTHVRRSGEVGQVTLLGESSIGSGIRRVDALVGYGAYAQGAKERVLLGQLTQLVGSRPEELPERISGLLGKLKESERELDKMRSAQLLAGAGELAGRARKVGTVQVVAADTGQISGTDALRSLVLDVRERLGADTPAVVALAGVSNDRPVIVVATTGPARAAGVKAGALVRTAARVLGGGGGGKDEIAQGGGTDPGAVGAALSALISDLGGDDA
ncbi:alanine--tRNA ligase [Pseudactinotalea sp. Z1739]|uniref:alanine--tRNA ligase n=1 Tax=Pseudactinotalea sp. Z1739 TaxID=3413028 RepID=UPI003C7E713F